MALFCVVEVNGGTEEREIFECPLSWFSKDEGMVCYPTGSKFSTWKGRTDKPPFSKGATWIKVSAILKGEFSDYRSAVASAKRLEVLDTSEEEAFRSNPRKTNALLKGAMGFSVENMLTERNIVSNIQLRPPDQTSSTSSDIFHVKSSGIICGVDTPAPEAIHQSSHQEDTLQQDVGNLIFTLHEGAHYDYEQVQQGADTFQTESPHTLTYGSNEMEVQNVAVTADTLAEQISPVVTKAFMNEFAKVHARLDKITEAIAVLGITQKEPIKVPKSGIRNPSYLLPIADESQIEELDNLLRNSEVNKAFIEEMSRFAGKSGAMRGQKVALNTIDKWFTREFLLQCSWTGSMKSKTKTSEQDTDDTQDEIEEKKMKKINFSSYRRVFEAFYSVVLLADSRYSKVEAEDFLKKQLRNAYSRLKQLKGTEENKAASKKSGDKKAALKKKKKTRKLL